MGVWIETSDSQGCVLVGLVTPCMGVWIETASKFKDSKVNKSHPVWVCGLKLEFR